MNLFMISPKHLIIGLLLVAATQLASWLRPTHLLADQYPNFDLEALPKQFNSWQAIDMANQLINPQEQASLNKIYAQTLGRQYINRDGKHIMLSIAYGKHQTDSVGVHLPEGCYGGQGFAIGQNVQDAIKTPYGTIPVTRVIANKGQRIEPITYWLTVGNHLVYGGWPMKKARMFYAFQRVVPDSFLVRVSSISADAESAYSIEQKFIEDLLAAMPPEQRKRLTGGL